MAIEVFDLTEFTQLAIRRDTGLHDGLSLHIYTSNDEWLSEHIEQLKAEGRDIPPIHSTSDAVEWSRAVEMAHWIINADERYNTRKKPSWWVVGECDQCKLAYCCDHLDECRTKDADGNWIHPCNAFMKEE